ncbi:hypothetical protein D9M69_639790 [compost metagenome]
MLGRGFGGIGDGQANIFDGARGLHHRREGAILVHHVGRAGDRPAAGETEQVRALLPGRERQVVQGEHPVDFLLHPQPRQFRKQLEQRPPPHLVAILAAVDRHEIVPERYPVLAIEQQDAEIDALQHRHQLRRQYLSWCKRHLVSLFR